MDAALFVKALGGLFAIMNPFVNLPMFLSLTSSYDASRQKRAAVRVGLYSLLFAVVIMLTGTALLRFFGISLDDFRIAGGIVLMTIALGMLHGGSSAHAGTKDEQVEQHEAAAQTDISFYPMTFPLIMGPGTITALIVFTSTAHGIGGFLTVASALVLVLGLLFVTLWFAPAIGHRMSASLRTIMTRLMGMVLAAIAVSMVIAGLQAVFPGLR